MTTFGDEMCVVYFIENDVFYGISLNNNVSVWVGEPSEDEDEYTRLRDRQCRPANSEEAKLGVSLFEDYNSRMGIVLEDIIA